MQGVHQKVLILHQQRPVQPQLLPLGGNGLLAGAQTQHVHHWVAGHQPDHHKTDKRDHKQDRDHLQHPFYKIP